MKNILSVFIVLVFVAFGAGVAFAADHSETLEFAWEYAQPTYPEDLQFLLFMRGEDAQYNYDTPIATVNYDEAVGMRGENEFTVTGAAGETVTKYFVLRAKTNGIESGNSNEATWDFNIPVSTPFSLTIKFKVTPE